VVDGGEPGVDSRDEGKKRLAERRIHRLNIHAYARDSRRVVTGSPTHDHCMGQQFFSGRTSGPCVNS